METNSPNWMSNGNSASMDIDSLRIQFHQLEKKKTSRYYKDTWFRYFTRTSQRLREVLISQFLVYKTPNFPLLLS